MVHLSQGQSDRQVSKLSWIYKIMEELNLDLKVISFYNYIFFGFLSK